jgi:choline transport protein
VLLQRNFKAVTIFGFSVILMASWEVILSTATLGLGNGGSAGLLYMLLATWIGFICIYASLGEQGSMAPTSGGQYHWVSEFAPRRFQKSLSYMVGWLGVLGWQAGIAFSSFLVGTLIQGLLVLNYEDYVFKRWHGTCLAIACLCFSVVFNTFLAQRLHLVEGCILVLHIFGFFAIIVPLWVLSPRASSKEVWTTFYDPGWGSQGLSTLVGGIVASVAPLLGADAAGTYSNIHCCMWRHYD